MENFFQNETLSNLILQYGSFAIFFLLMLGIIALPVPEETLMVFSGVLMAQGTLPIHSTVIAAYAGSMAGITISYLLGRTLGHYFVVKYGGWIGLTEDRLQKIRDWFDHFGKWTLVIGYFIPGVRHFTGFFAGMSELKYSHFALYAYMGSILWVTTFLSIGYFFKNCCLEYLEAFVEEFEILDVALISAGILFIIFIAFKIYYLKHKK